MRESEKKASNSAAFNWQSTWAVKHLETIIKEAAPQKGEPIYTLPKATGKQKEFGYVNIATLYYECHSNDREFLNFKIKLVLGIKSEGRHVQYSVNKVEVTKKASCNKVVIVIKQSLVQNAFWLQRYINLLISQHFHRKNLKTLAGNGKVRIFASSEMTNPVFSAWGKPSPTLPKLNRVVIRMATLVYLKYFFINNP